MGNIWYVIQIEEGEIRNHLDGLGKTSIEKVLNLDMDEESDQFAGPYGMSGTREGWTLVLVATSGNCRQRP